MTTKTRTTIAALAAAATLALAGCSSTPTYTFEGEPRDSMTGDDDGYEGDPRQVQCFDIEADGQSFGESDDTEDQQLGTFCRTEQGGQTDGPVEQDDDQEGDD